MEWDVAISIKVNLWLGGVADEPLCSRIWHNALFSQRWELVRKVTDFLFQVKEAEHCWSCHLRYLRRRLARPASRFRSLTTTLCALGSCLSLVGVNPMDIVSNGGSHGDAP